MDRQVERYGVRAIAGLLLAWWVAGTASAQELRVDLWKSVKNAIVALDKQADGGRCVIANLGEATGTAFAAETPVLKPGVYDAVLHLKYPKINNLNTAPVNWVCEITGAGSGHRDFDIMVIERAGVYQDVGCRFTVNDAGTAQVSLSWRRESLKSDGSGVRVRVEKGELPAAPSATTPGDEGKEPASDLELETQLASEPPIEGLKYLYAAIDRVLIVPRGDVAVSSLEVDKIRYRPGEPAKVAVTVKNYRGAAANLKVETVFVNDLDTELPVDQRELKLGPGAEEAFTCTGPAFVQKWGYAVRTRVFEGERLLSEKSEYFTVHENMWAVVIAGRAPAQFTAHVTRENAIASARSNRQRYRNWVESGFWAPDEFGDFTPDTEHWWGGQGCYYGGVTGTKMMIEEGHKAGISFAVYSNIWGGDGPPAFEMVRAHPDWGYAATFDVEWFERWDHNTMGTGKGGRGMHVWPVTCVNYGKPEVFEHHARELIGTHRMFGWDAVRYDSHDINAGNARVVDIVKKVVRAEVPDFQFGYNSSVPMGVATKIEPFKAECEGEGLIMEEGIRQYGGGGMSYSGGRTYEEFARRILGMKEEARKYGGHFLAIGMDRCFPNDLVYQYIFWFAGNTHPCYDWGEVSVANYMQFATRYAGQLWDLRVTSVPRALERVDFGEAKACLFLPERYIHQRDLGNGRRQLIIHLINAPAEKVLYTNDDCKLPPVRENLRVTVKLPPAATVRQAWCLTAEPQLTQQKLAAVTKDGAVQLTVPRLRFWNMVVLDLENAPAFE